MKQRLLGAVVLIALAIIFVPMFLSGTGPKQDSETVSLEIPPAPNREFETRVLPVDANKEESAPLPSQAAEKAEPIATVDTKAPAKVDVFPEAVKPVALEPSPETTTAQAEPVKLPTAEQEAAGKGANGQYLVHLGVYSTTKNAEDLVATLKRSGFPAFAESIEFQGKPAQSVRVGPFADRAEAEAARIRIKQVKGDVPSSVLSLATDAKADAPASALPPTKAGGWAVQLGAFATAEDANKLRGRLQAAGFAGFVDKVAAEGKTLWRVRAGPETDRANADKLRERIKEKLKVDGIIVTQP